MIDPARSNRYIVRYPINVNENGEEIESTKPENHEYNDKDWFEFPEPERIDGYAFDYWKCRDKEYKVGDTLEIV